MCCVKKYGTFLCVSSILYPRYFFYYSGSRVVKRRENLSSINFLYINQNFGKKTQPQRILVYIAILNFMQASLSVMKHLLNLSYVLTILTYCWTVLPIHFLKPCLASCRVCSRFVFFTRTYLTGLEKWNYMSVFGSWKHFA